MEVERMMNQEMDSLPRTRSWRRFVALALGLAIVVPAAMAADKPVPKTFELNIPVKVSRVMDGIKVQVTCNVKFPDGSMGTASQYLALTDGAYEGTIKLSGEVMANRMPMGMRPPGNQNITSATYSCMLRLTDSNGADFGTVGATDNPYPNFRGATGVQQAMYVTGEYPY